MKKREETKRERVEGLKVEGNLVARIGGEPSFLFGLVSSGHPEPHFYRRFNNTPSTKGKTVEMLE